MRPTDDALWPRLVLSPALRPRWLRRSRAEVAARAAHGARLHRLAQVLLRHLRGIAELELGTGQSIGSCRGGVTQAYRLGHGDAVLAGLLRNRGLCGRVHHAQALRGLVRARVKQERLALVLVEREAWFSRVQPARDLASADGLCGDAVDAILGVVHSLPTSATTYFHQGGTGKLTSSTKLADPLANLWTMLTAESEKGMLTEW